MKITSSDGLHQVEVFQREDGTFGYVESLNTGTSVDPVWTPGRPGASRFDAIGQAVSEAEGRVAWLKREASWPAKDVEAGAVRPYAEGWIECPFCGTRFSLRDRDRWNGERHTTCGQRIVIL